MNTMNNQLITANQSLAGNDPRKVFDLLDISEATKIDYGSRIQIFLDFVRNKGFTRNSFLEFKRFLADKTEMSVSSKNKLFISAKVFLKELNRQGVLTTDITQNIKTFKQSKRHKRDGLNDDEIKLLSEWAKSLSLTATNSRIKLMLCLLIFQGLRQIEIVRLNVTDVDCLRKTLLVLGKGQDDKEIVDLHPQTVNALRGYLELSKKKDGALFTSQSTNRRNKRLSTRGLRLIVKTVLTELGIGHRVVQGFRHFFTTKLLQTYKGDLLQVAELTRHRNLEMLQVYNDSVKKEQDLPRYYEAFNGVNFAA